MDWQQLKSFYHIATLGSLSKAALAMHRSQPALSKHLKLLEASLGCRLFTRLNSRTMRLTEEGRCVLRFAEDVFARHGLLQAELEDLKKEGAGRVTLACGAATLSLMLPDVITRFRESYPHAKLTLLEQSPDVAFDLLARGSADLALALDSQVPSYLQTYKWRQVHYLLMLPKRHPLLDRSRITIEDIAGYPVIKLFSNIRFASGMKLEQAFAERGLEMDVFLEARNIYLMADFVRRGFGVSLVTALSDRLPLWDEELEFIPLDHLFSPEMIMICTRKNTALSPCAAALLSMLLQSASGGGSAISLRTVTEADQMAP